MMESGKMMQPVMGSCPANMTCMMMTPMMVMMPMNTSMDTSMMMVTKAYECNGNEYAHDGHDARRYVRDEYLNDGDVQNESENMTSMMSMMSMIQSGKMMPLGTMMLKCN